MTDIEQDIEGAIESREHLDAKIVHLEEENEQLRNLCDIAGREEQFAIDEEEKLQARIEAIHYTDRKHDVEVCAECGSLWPCPTYKALKGEGE